MFISSDISLFWLFPWLILCIAVALFFYRKNSWFEGLPTKYQWLLRILRTTTLFFVGLLLFAIIFQLKSYRNEKPIAILLVDRSASMLNYSDSNLVESQLNKLRKDINNRLDGKFELTEISISDDIKYGELKGFISGFSDLSEGFRQIRSDFYSRNIGAVIFVSDGNYNRGVNPIYEAGKLNFTPVYSLIVGDTIQKRDHFIKNVAFNDIAFLNNKFPLEVDIEGVKMGKGLTEVSLVKAGKVLASQTIKYTDGASDFVHVSFLVNADKIGFQSYSVVLKREGRESSYENNVRNFYVEVMDSRRKVLVLAGAPHPDVATFIESLGTDQNLDISSVLTKDWDKSLKNVDLVVWHEPGIGFSQEIYDGLVAKQIPVLYCIGPNTPTSIVGKLKVGMQVTGSNQFDETQGSWNQGFTSFIASPELQRSLTYYPPLKTRFGQMTNSNGLDIAVYQRIGPITKKEPLLYFGQQNDVKFGVIYGEGIWRWRMNEFARNGSFELFNELIQKTTQFLVIKKDASRLQVQFPKRFTKEEEIFVNAAVYNNSLERITSPAVNMVVKSTNGKTLKREFARGTDMYRLSLGKLKPGKYSWSASTSLEGKRYSKSGEFIVEDISLEQLNSSSNALVMKQLAMRSGGKFSFLKEYAKSIDDLLARKDITTMSYSETSFNDLIDIKFLFFLLLALLSLEWFLRKWLGAY